MGKLLGKGDSAWSWCQYCALKKSAGLSAVPFDVKSLVPLLLILIFSISILYLISTSIFFFYIFATQFLIPLPCQNMNFVRSNNQSNKYNISKVFTIRLQRYRNLPLSFPWKTILSTSQGTCSWALEYNLYTGCLIKHGFQNIIYIQGVSLNMGSRISFIYRVSH